MDQRKSEGGKRDKKLSDKSIGYSPKRSDNEKPKYSNSNKKPAAKQYKQHGGRNPDNQFEPYLSPPEVQRGLQTGELLEGVLRINTKNYEDGFICAKDGLGQDIYLKGVRARCRALNGDLVVVRLNPSNEWVVNHAAVDDFLDKEGTEEDRRILMEDCVVNVKVEQEEVGLVKSQVDFKVSVDTYNTPVRGKDTVSVTQWKTVAEGERVPDGGGEEGGGEWGVKVVKQEVKWDTGEVVENKLAMEVLGEVMGGKTRRGARGKKGGEKTTLVSEQKGVTVVASVEQVAVDLPPHQRVKVEREDGEMDPVCLVGGKEGKSDVVIEKSFSDPSASVVPLEEITVSEELSDNESHHSDHLEADIEQELEDEAFKLANLRISEGKEDVIVPELTAVNTSRPIVDIADDSESDADVVVETVEKIVNSTSEKGKSTRRGKRRSKHGSVSSVDTALNTTTDSCTSTQSTASGGYTKRLPKLPLVQYSVEAVLAHKASSRLPLVQQTAQVVFIREYKHSRRAAGTIKPMQDRNPRFLLFSPTDSKVPRMKIPMSEAPPNFQTRPQDYSGVMFVARITKWDMVNSALGTIERSLGLNSDIAVRTEGLLLENNIDYGEFPEAAIADLPPNSQTWTIPDQEVQRRRDFRQECVFTIDPLTARDLDDALSITLDPDGLYRVGVHIADVSYFVRQGTPLDQVAANRSTSTYLVDQVVPMLPRPLCENLCSLNPAEDRLCFTVEWKMNEKAQIVSEYFGRTVIRSCTKLAYEHAQSMIEDPGRDWSSEENAATLPSITGGYSAATIASKVNMLQMLALQLRTKREAAGALRLDQPKLCFTLNRETGLPDGYKLHEHRHSNKLIEEFMLLANMAVAHKIYSSFGDIAVLRRHPPYKAAMMELVVEQLSALGVEIDTSSAGSMASSLDRLKLSEGTPEERETKMAVVTNLCSKPMELARYFCTGMMNIDEFHHFALNVPLYTHFTSPIRRYPDVMVHRLLDAAITGRRPKWEAAWVQQVTEHCNDMRLAAKRVGESSAELFLGLFIAECGPLQQPGAVVQVMDHSLDVLVIEMGVIKRVYVDRLGVVRHTFRRTQGVSYIDLVWGQRGEQVTTTLTLLSRVNVTLSKGDKPFEINAVIEPPERDSVNRIITLD